MAPTRTGDREVFRPSWILCALMAMAGLLWLFVLGYLLTFDGVPVKTLLGAALFVIFFAAAMAYYGRSAIFVDARGVTYRGIIRTRRLSWDDIRKLEVMPGPITVYAIRGSSGPCHFTSFFRNHRRLAELLVERAGLGAGSR